MESDLQLMADILSSLSAADESYVLGYQDYLTVSAVYERCPEYSRDALNVR